MSALPSKTCYASMSTNYVLVLVGNMNIEVMQTKRQQACSQGQVKKHNIGSRRVNICCASGAHVVIRKALFQTAAYSVAA